MSLIKQIFELKRKGITNADIARMLNLRRQDLSVLFKLVKKDEELKEELKKLNEISKLQRELNKKIELIAKIKQEKEELQTILEKYKNNLSKCKKAYNTKNKEIKKLTSKYNLLKKFTIIVFIAFVIVKVIKWLGI